MKHGGLNPFFLSAMDDPITPEVVLPIKLMGFIKKILMVVEELEVLEVTLVSRIRLTILLLDREI